MDATKSTVEELEQVTLFEKFLKRKFHLGTGLHPKLSPGLLPLATKEAVMVSKSTSGVWTLFTDGASNVKGSDLGVVLNMSLRETLRHAIRIVPLTNNEGEYETLIVGLELTRGLDSEVIEIKCNYQLVVNQVYGIFEAKEKPMKQYAVKFQARLSRFPEWSITRIPRRKCRRRRIS
ncbi:PREDICTED: uncharacterized protein LOC109219377 [Nicotiana attenuata]|uniref:uncharacterized protein LOC109219377 n=1 Tax=Nicotiana attenuata TaxID=49451 RepID=UPI0009053AC2|nr:PREDICTED: uncharacterized protein LOC109219377 [Nicotiana attenuata]